MSFPVSPTDGQSATVNNIRYTYSSSNNSWKKIAQVDYPLDITVGGILTVNGESSLGAIANVHITGGSSGQLISTDGTGNLSFIDAPSSFNAGKAYALNLLFGG